MKTVPSPTTARSTPVNRMTLREQVLQHLYQDIVDGEYRPGTVLTETDLATHYGVSRGTVPGRYSPSTMSW